MKTVGWIVVAASVDKDICGDIVARVRVLGDGVLFETVEEAVIAGNEAGEFSPRSDCIKVS